VVWKIWSDDTVSIKAGELIAPTANNWVMYEDENIRTINYSLVWKKPMIAIVVRTNTNEGGVLVAKIVTSNGQFGWIPATFAKKIVQ